MSSPMQKSRLGRGLASLIGDTAPVRAAAPAEGEQRLIAVSQLIPSKFNPRKDFREDELAELAESIRAKGLVQPIIVRPHPEVGGAFEIVAGERRWRAARLAERLQVPVIVRELDDQDVLELAIIENVQRADLNAIEEAWGYRELIERFSYSQERLADVIGKSRSHLANTLRLLKLPERVQDMVKEGRLTAGHARALVGRADAEELAERVAKEGLNVREVEALVQSIAEGAGGIAGQPRRKRDKDPDTRAFEKELTDTLGLAVEIKRGSGESGVLSIRYGNFEQLDWLHGLLSRGQN
jgi:ParB family transcriptional regulator, chromosome partitioning protein